MSERLEKVEELAEVIASLDVEHPLRVAIDGRTASGKTTLADEIAAVLKQTGREVVRTGIDGFHNPKAIRYARGRRSAKGYYCDARNCDAIITELLEPLGPNGDRSYKTSNFDLEKDEPVHQSRLRACEDAIFLIDGTFLQRPELRNYWDYVVYVAVSEETARRRGILRDANKLGGESAAARVYDERYLGAFAFYTKEIDPFAGADAICFNETFSQPMVQFQRPR